MASTSSINRQSIPLGIVSGLPVIREEYRNLSLRVQGMVSRSSRQCDRQLADYQATSNVAPLLNLHYHKRYIVTLWLVIYKVGYFGQNAFNDFPRRHSAARPQQALEFFHPPELARRVGRLRDSVCVCHQNVAFRQLELRCLELNLREHADRHSLCTQVKQFTALRPGPHDDRRIMARIHILQPATRRLVLCIEE